MGLRPTPVTQALQLVDPLVQTQKKAAQTESHPSNEMLIQKFASIQVNVKTVLKIIK